MSNPTLKEVTELNELLAGNVLRKGQMRVLPFTEGLPFITLVNTIPFKLPKDFKSVETIRTFANREKRIIKVLWVMDLVGGKRCVYYPNPVSVKLLYNNRLESETQTGSRRINTASNVLRLYRIDATYIVNNDVETFYDATARVYE